MRILLSMVGWKWLQNTFCRGRRQLVKKFLSVSGLDSSFDLTEFLRFNMAGSVARYWWFGGFRHWTRSDFDQIVRVEGWEHIEKAQSKGKGIILVHHHLKITHLVWVLLARRGFTDRATIGKLVEDGFGGKKAAGGARLADPVAIMMNYARQLQNAKEVLGRGGVVRIVPDGYRGSSKGMEFTFFNKIRTFRTGFSDLALTTGADIIPASASMDRSGCFTVSFYPALQKAQDLDAKAQSAAWVGDYVDYLQLQWQSPSLRFMSIPNMQSFLQLSPAPGEASE